MQVEKNKNIDENNAANMEEEDDKMDDKMDEMKMDDSTKESHDIVKSNDDVEKNVHVEEKIVMSKDLDNIKHVQQVKMNTIITTTNMNLSKFEIISIQPMDTTTLAEYTTMQQQQIGSVPYQGKCRYKSGKCFRERALKRNGQAHTLCDGHRIRQNAHQRKSDRKHREMHSAKNMMQQQEETREGLRGLDYLTQASRSIEGASGVQGLGVQGMAATPLPSLRQFLHYAHYSANTASAQVQQRKTAAQPLVIQNAFEVASSNACPTYS